MLFNANDDLIPELITDPRSFIGLSDGGAHVDMPCDAGYCTYLLGTWVREKEALSLEYRVQRLTSEPADFFGLRDRGRLAVGTAADIVVFDSNTVGSGRRPEMRYDLPGNGRRLVMPAHRVPEHGCRRCRALGPAATHRSAARTGAPVLVVCPDGFERSRATKQSRQLGVPRRDCFA